MDRREYRRRRQDASRTRKKEIAVLRCAAFNGLRGGMEWRSFGGEVYG